MESGTAAAVCADAPSKATFRRWYRRKRRTLSAEQQRCHAEAVARALWAHIRPADIVAVYIRMDGEIDLAPLVARCRRRGVAVAAPTLADGNLRFAAYAADEPMRRGRYGMLEPANAAPVRPALVLTPLVAFDERGNRLGMGGGHYDRYFAEHPKARRVGVAHECQLAPALPVDPWDVPLTAVVTEQGWRAFGGRG